MKLTEKAKRYLLVLGGILLCAGLLVAIWFQLKPEAVPEERFEAETGEVTEITVDMEQEEEKGQGAQNGDGIVETEPESLQAETELETESGETAQDGLENGADDGQEKDTVQSIQPDVKKPEVPEEALKNPDQQPGENAPGETTGQEEPQADDTDGGQIFIPGFGWVENEGGGSSGTVAQDMYENGNKIGVMD